MPESRLLQRFYRDEVSQVARALLGKLIRRQEVVLRITEVEAYGGPEDSASHARFGPKGRSAPMFGPPGRAYVYLCYGMHDMFNIVTGPSGRGAAVLVRAAEPRDGLAIIEARRGGRSGPPLLAGPGRVGQALDVDPSWSGHRLYRPGDLEILDGPAPEGPIVAAPRVGIDFARQRDRERRWRFAVSDSAWVSRPRPK